MSRRPLNLLYFARVLNLPVAFLTFLSMTSVAFAQTTGKAELEGRIQSKLDRILTEDEYLIDIKMQQNTGGQAASASSDSFLPGLQVLGPTPENAAGSPNSIILGGKADILLILDKKVSKERARVAQDIVNRIVESEGLKSFVKVSAQQKDITKVPPAETPPGPAKDPTVLDQLIREKDFVARAVLVFWGGLVSIMALYFVLRRLLLSGAELGGGARSGGDNAQASVRREEVLAPAPAKSGKSERTRDDYYSKDEATLNAIREITEEAKAHPKKIARILSKWVAQTDDLARAASLFLRNCDIKTIELVCQAMHPSDLEKVIEHVIDDFEPFGQENHRVIERMRADLAVLASEQVVRERPDPLNFLKRLSDDDIRNILEGESEETIALVATQLPAHRLQKFYDTVQPDAMKAILAQFSSIQRVSLTDFEPLQAQLNHKLESLAGNLVSEKDRVNSIYQMVVSVASPVLQCEMIYRLHADNTEVYAKVRSSLLVATDLRFLSPRVKTLLIQSIDADTLGTAVSDFSISFEQLMDSLPDAYQAVFGDAQSRRYDAAVVNAAWKKVSSTIYEMVSAGLIGKTEIAATARRADTPVAKEKAVDGEVISSETTSGASETADVNPDDNEGNRGAA
jgi:hypothetical protein